MKNIYVFGSINTDLVCETSRFPMQGETLIGTDFFTAQGGKGANQAVAASRLGGKVKMAGKVGNDIFGTASISSLKEAGVDVEHISQVDGPSGTAIIVLCEHDNRIVINPGANGLVDRSDVDTFLAGASRGDIFVTQLENPVDVIGYALEAAHKKGMYVVLNPAPVNMAIAKYLKHVDLIIPNEGECALLGGEEMLLQLVPIIIVTLGGDGYKIITKEVSKQYSCIKVDPVDTTAAGDTFIGGLVSYLGLGHTLEESARFGSVAASLACTRKGAQPSIPTLEEVNKYL